MSTATMTDRMAPASRRLASRIAGVVRLDLRYCVLLAVAGCLLIAQPLRAADGVNGNLVTVNWLENHRNSADVLVLDASPTQLYMAGHIPGAVSVDLFSLLSFGLREMPVADIEQLYQSLGVSPGRRIVMYDQGGTFLATRLLYSLLYHGFPSKDLFIVDGGLFKWQKEGLPVTKDISPAPRRGSFRIDKPDEDVRARLPEFLTASGDPVNNVLLEANGADWHFGEVQAFHRAGHIPGAVLLPSADFFNADKTFKSAEEIGRMLTYLSIRPEQQIYTHCGGGVAASVPFFALKFILHYPRVKLYTESQMGWLFDDRELPYWTYDAPYLMRETNWLPAWGGRMMRMYGNSQVSIVDVRPAGAFNQGHLPFALNVPAEVFRKNIASPDKLAEILGSAGVSPTHEAVVISGAGLTKDAALAFVLLEKVGQKRTSVYLESMDSPETLDRLAQRGFAVTKAATVVGPRKSSQDVSIPPVAYAGNVRKGVIIADPTTAQGIFPRVFVASGASVPADAPAGQVVHVPYTSLLNADGTPKAAKDIWNILVKAGVPRHAELVLISDDPGEAAVNYFVLKLMGYPDLKVVAR